MTKTICMIALSSYPRDPRIRRQAEALAEIGFEVDIICKPSLGQNKIEKFGNVTAYRIMNVARKESMKGYIFSSFIFLVSAFIRIQILDFKRHYQLIQVHNMPDYLVFAGVIQKLKKIPIILDIHDLTVELFEEKWPASKHKLLMLIVKYGENISCRFADKIITVTETCKQRLVSRGIPENKITLILNSANIDVFQFRSRHFQKLSTGVNLLYHGTIAHRFGIHYAVNAMKIIIGVLPGSTLSIYGRYDSAYKKYLENLVVKLNLQNNVKLNGFIDVEKVHEIIDNADIGIIPYPTTDYMHLALPTKAFEYISSGLPVVITKLHDFSLLFPDDSLTYLDNLGSEVVAKTIINLSLNPEERKNKVDKAFKKLKTISGDVMKERYLELIDVSIKKISFNYIN